MIVNETIDKTCESYIKKIIAAQGKITFKDFMQLALYSEHGYYTSNLPKLGSKGDFVTAPELTPLFGQCIARQILEISKQLDKPISIMELGPGKGTLAKDVIEYLSQQQIKIEHYYLVETSPTLTQVQQQTLQPYDCCRWSKTIGDIEPFTGVILANELLDALAVHKVQLCEQHQEWYVTLDKDQMFQLQLGKLSSDKLHQQIATMLASIEHPLPYPYDTEFNLEQAQVLQACYNVLTQGVMLFIDYGFGEREYYHPSRHMGTIMTHYQHTSSPDPLKNVGLQDITAHVDFTALTRCGTQIGLDLLGFAPQAHFLMSLKLLQNAAIDFKQSQAIQTLVNPQEMGELFKAIAFGKDFAFDLEGFKRDFSRLL